MVNKNIVLSLFYNINFIIVVFLYQIKKGKIRYIDEIYFINSNKTNSKNDISLTRNTIYNYVTFYHNLDSCKENIIEKKDILSLLSHITILRIISRNNNQGWSIITDNKCSSNLNKYLNVIKDYKKLNLFPIINFVFNSYCQNNNTLCYLVNKKSAKILVFTYIMFINRIYYNN